MNNSTYKSTNYEIIDTTFSDQRLDNYLLSRLKKIPRSHIYHLIRSGQVRVNSSRVRPSYRLKEGDKVRIPPVFIRNSTQKKQMPSNVDFLKKSIIYEDDKLIILNKPSGIAVHSGTGVDYGCIELLRIIYPRLKELDLVHRLDRGTSGCLLVAKKRSTLRQLHLLIRKNLIEKRYLALLKGSWQLGNITIDDPLLTYRRSNGQSFVKVSEEGKMAKSHFKFIESFGEIATLVEVIIETGRTHQIRAHAKSLGHPVAGDQQYGDKDFNILLKRMGLNRIFLHAHSISFAWQETYKDLSVSCPLPKDLRELHSKIIT